MSYLLKIILAIHLLFWLEIAYKLKTNYKQSRALSDNSTYHLTWTDKFLDFKAYLDY